MELDFLLPDELELIEEANCVYEEEYVDLIPPDLYSEEEEEKSPHPQDPQINGQKRPRSEELDSPCTDNVESSEEKRIKTDYAAPDCVEDEEWLRYPPPLQPVESVKVVEEKHEKTVFKYASHIDGDCIPVTGPNGDMVFVKMSRFETETRWKKLDVGSQSSGLILEPIDVLLQRVEQEAFTKALQSSSEVESEMLVPEPPTGHEQLWVDKYAPNSFTELLSDEHTNREVLLWLKQWDSRVFKSEIRSTSEEVLSTLRRHSSKSQHHKHSDPSISWNNKGPRWSNERFKYSNNLDQKNSNATGKQELLGKNTRLTGTPEEKILLLCGPPGLGKTTLAHVAAKHCGYRVVELNASDDRSSSTIESKILDVVQMNSVMDDSRPKCLVIDEIDGSLGDGKGAVDVILKMVAAERKSDVGKENIGTKEQSGRTSSKKGRKAASLSRPVICICNDLYAPVLRPLRQIAKVHTFLHPTLNRVVKRLKYICNKEGLKISSIALTALAEYTECDIRSCLNTLQFLNKRREILNVVDISSQVVGRKDMSRSVFDIWKGIFHKRKVKRERINISNRGSMSDEFNFLHSLVSNRGDYDLIFDGIHENILQLLYHDPMMQKTVKCLDSLGISDMMHQYVMRTQQMSLLAYQPSIAVHVHNLVSQVQKPNIQWPKCYQRSRTMWMEKIDALRSWHYKITPSISRHLSIKSFVEDSISMLLHILSPPTLRPAALHLLSEKEKSDLSQLISTMVSYSVTYKSIKSDVPTNLRQEPTVDASTLHFDPPITDFINFKGYTSGHYVLSLALKQVLVHEVEKKKIMQVSGGRSIHLTDGCEKENQESQSGNTNSLDAHAKKTIINAKNVPNPRPSTVPSTLASSISFNSSMKSKSAPEKKKPRKDSPSFFDRFRKVPSGSQNSTKTILQLATFERDSRPILFKFNEGFTNAVKRPVRMREFLV